LVMGGSAHYLVLGPSYHGDHTYNLLYLYLWRDVQAASQRCITCTHSLCRVIPLLKGRKQKNEQTANNYSTNLHKY